jgi:hypothetical protein
MNHKKDEAPSEAEIAGRSRLDHIYTHDWANGEGRYLNVILDDNGDPQGVDIDLEPDARNRVKVTLTFVREAGDIRMIELKKFKHYKRRGWQPAPDSAGFGHEHITLRPFTFGKLLSVLRFITELDVKGITQRRLALAVDGMDSLDEETKRTLRTFLVRKGGAELMTELLKTDLVDSQDIVNLGYRKKQLRIFQDLLASPDAAKVYVDEAVWQHFFSRNEWIFGYGLDYRFRRVLQDQFHASASDADGSEAVISDYLLGDHRFTTFVELKTPETPLFSVAKNRSRAWRLSLPLLDGVSQILEHKASGLLRFERGDLFDETGKKISQKPYDPKVILIVGHWDQLKASASDRERQTKERTFELFRRDSRNVEILTYDEVLERATFIVEHRGNSS